MTHDDRNCRTFQRMAAVLAEDIERLLEVIKNGHEMSLEKAIKQVERTKRIKDEMIENPWILDSRYEAMAWLHAVAAQGLIRPTPLGRVPA